MLQALIRSAKNRLGRPGLLVRGLAAYGSAEIATRIVRLATTVIIARSLVPTIVGEAALALTIFELVRVLERVGTGQRIVCASERELAATCNSVQRLYFVWTATLIVLQIAVAAVLALLLGRPVAGAMLAALCPVYLFMAFGHVQYSLAMRAKLTGGLARLNASQNIADQVLTAILLLIWPSPWSIVLPKLLTAPMWLVMARQLAPWRPDHAAGTIPAMQLLRYSAPLLLSECLTALRTQGDDLIIAAMLGTAALGTYYFAFNAGLGIVSSIVSAFGQVAFPMLGTASAGAARTELLRRLMLAGTALLVPLVALQGLAAPLYVPIVFGAHWSFAAPLISIFCLAGLPLLAMTLSSCWLRAEGRVHHDAAASGLACIAALGGLALGAGCGGLAGAVGGLVLGQTLAMTIPALRILLPALRSHGNHRSLAVAS